MVILALNRRSSWTIYMKIWQESNNMEFQSTNNSGQKFPVVSLLTLLITGVIFTGASYVMMKRDHIDASWKNTPGHIVDVNVDLHDDAPYTAIYEYEIDGETHRVRSFVSSSSRPSIGSLGKIAYNPENPAESKVVEKLSTRLMFMIFPIIGIGLLILSPIFFIRSRLKRRE